MTRTAALETLTRLARTNYGVFMAADALEAGLTLRMLTYHTSQGHFRRLARGVYAVTGEADWRQPLMAAQLWGGPESVLAGRSAAALMGLDGASRRAEPELYTPRWRSHPRWTIHRGMPRAADLVVQGRFRHTNGLRTLMDLSRAVDLDALEIVAESVLRMRVASEDDLCAAPQLRPLVERRPRGAPAAQSELETRMIQLLRQVNVPEPVRQHPVALSPSWIVYLDLAFPDACIFIETDGRAYHEGSSILRDRHRQNAIVRELGWIPLRFGWSDVVDHPRHTAREVERSYQQARQRITTGTSADRGRARR